jgi:hypothetical protein
MPEIECTRIRALRSSLDEFSIRLRHWFRTGKFIATTVPISGGWGSVADARTTDEARSAIIAANADAGSIAIYFPD